MERLRDRTEMLQRPSCRGVTDRERAFAPLADEDVFQMRAQHLVVAVVAVDSGRGREDLAPLELLQELLAVGAIQEAVADRAVEAAQHACVEEQRARERRKLSVHGHW